MILGTEEVGLVLDLDLIMIPGMGEFSIPFPSLSYFLG